jgi:hypothetical protein
MSDDELTNNIIAYLTKLYDSDSICKNNYKTIDYSKNITIYDVSTINNFYYDIMSKVNLMKYLGRHTVVSKNHPDYVLNVDIVKSINDRTTLSTVYQYTIGNFITKYKILQNINDVDIFKKIKDVKGDKYDYSNHRFMMNHSDAVKIIDKMYILTINTLCNNIVNTSIYKSEAHEFILWLAIKQTSMKYHNVILLDITKAYDNIDWCILKELLFRSYSKKVSPDVAGILVEEYMLILTNRKFKFENNQIIVKRGIPQGLPSSSFIFTLYIQEIIEEWLAENNFKINIDFKLILYVDDVYIKILNNEYTMDIITSLIDKFEMYKLFINKKKSKADVNLNINFLEKLTDSDLYLGVPFTRNFKKYIKLILDEYNDKHEDINKARFTWIDIYNNLSNYKLKYQLFGFLRYKLGAIMIYKNNNIPIDINNENVMEFIKKYILV